MSDARVMNQGGIEAFASYLEQLRADGTKPIPLSLLSDPEKSVPFIPQIQIQPRRFDNKYELALHLAETFKGVPRRELDYNRGLWAWLALFYFDELCPERGASERKPLKSYCYIPPAEDAPGAYRHYYRHLLAGPFRILKQHESRAAALLSFPVQSHPDVMEQIAAVQYLIRNPGFIDLLTQLYFKKGPGTTWEPRVGITNRNKPGTLRRLKEVMDQLDVTYDVDGMDVNQLAAVLPREFDRWQEPAL